MILYVARRLVYCAFILVVTAFFAYGGMRFLKPSLPQYRGTPWANGTWHDMSQALLHFNPGRSCMYNGCPKLHDLWMRGWFIDVSLLAGALVFGAIAGVAAGRWCAAHRRSVAA